jgi:hypothetical protein
MYIIYTNLTPRQQVPSTSNKVSAPPTNNTRIANSLKTNSNINQMRDRTSTILLPPIKTSLVVSIRSNSIGSEQNIGHNIPPDRNVDFFK